MPTLRIHAEEARMLQPRLNKVIELLEQGKVVFGGSMVWSGNVEEATAFAELGYDFIIFRTVTPRTECAEDKKDSFSVRTWA
jgi:hypothetical protein